MPPSSTVFLQRLRRKWRIALRCKLILNEEKGKEHIYGSTFSRYVLSDISRPIVTVESPETLTSEMFSELYDATFNSLLGDILPGDAFAIGREYVIGCAGTSLHEHPLPLRYYWFFLIDRLTRNVDLRYLPAPHPPVCRTCAGQILKTLKRIPIRYRRGPLVSAVAKLFCQWVEQTKQQEQLTRPPESAVFPSRDPRLRFLLPLLVYPTEEILKEACQDDLLCVDYFNHLFNAGEVLEFRVNFSNPSHRLVLGNFPRFSSTQRQRVFAFAVLAVLFYFAMTVAACLVIIDHSSCPGVLYSHDGGTFTATPLASAAFLMTVLLTDFKSFESDFSGRERNIRVAVKGFNFLSSLLWSFLVNIPHICVAVAAPQLSVLRRLMLSRKEHVPSAQIKHVQWTCVSIYTPLTAIVTFIAQGLCSNLNDGDDSDFSD